MKPNLLKKYSSQSDSLVYGIEHLDNIEVVSTESWNPFSKIIDGVRNKIAKAKAEKQESLKRLEDLYQVQERFAEILDEVIGKSNLYAISYKGDLNFMVTGNKSWAGLGFELHPLKGDNKEIGGYRPSTELTAKDKTDKLFVKSDGYTLASAISTWSSTSKQFWDYDGNDDQQEGFDSILADQEPGLLVINQTENPKYLLVFSSLSDEKSKLVSGGVGSAFALAVNTINPDQVKKAIDTIKEEQKKGFDKSAHKALFYV